MVQTEGTRKGKEPGKWKGVEKHSSFGTVKLTSSGRYRAFYTRKGKRVNAGTTFPNRLQADAWLKNEWGKLHDPNWRDPSGDQTLRSFVDAVWWPSKSELALRTRDTYESILTSWIYPEVSRPPDAPFSLGDLLLSEITAGHLDLWWFACRSKPKSARAAKAWRVLSQILRYAEERRAVAHNPMASVKGRGRGTEHARGRRALSSEQVAKLTQAMKEVEPRWEAMVLVAAACGLRFGEAVGLQRQDVSLDPEHPGLTVRRTVAESQSYGFSVGPLKGRVAGEERWCDLPSFVVPSLSARLGEIGEQPDAWVFTTSRGEHPRRSSFARTFRKARAKAKLPADVTYHSLRHTSATFFSQVPGASPRELMERFGWRSPSMALHYMHTDRERMRALTAEFDERFSDAFAPPAEGEATVEKAKEEVG